MSVCLGRFIERRGVLPTAQFAYGKSLSTCDALLNVFYNTEYIGEWTGGQDSAKNK